MSRDKLQVRSIPIDWDSTLPIYASENFLRQVGDEYGWIGGISNSGQIRCILPYTILRKPGFRIVRFRVETIPMVDDLDLEEERSFLNSAMEYFRAEGMHLVIPASNNAIFRTYPAGAIAAPYGTFIKELNQPEDALFAEISPDYRKNIRRATKAGVQIEIGAAQLGEAYLLIHDTLKRSGLRFKDRNSFVTQITQGLGENVLIALAKHAGQVQACMVAPFSRYSGYSWYSGTVAAPLKGAMHLVQWEVIRQLAQRGVARFNFTGVRIRPEAGSKQEGIANFKMRFGGRLVQGYMWKYSLRPLKFAAYSAAVRLLRGGDVVDRERHKMAGT